MTDLVLDNIGLAIRQARSLGSQYRYILNDLEQAAIEGLVFAARKYDPTQGTFGNYSYLWIKSALQRELCRQTPVKLSACDDLTRRKVHATVATLRGRDTEVTIESIAEEGGIDPKLVKLLYSYRNPLSTDYDGDHNALEDGNLLDKVMSYNDSYAALEVEELMEDLPDEQVVMMTYRMLGFRNKDIAEEMDLHERYVSDHLQKASAQLKEEHGQA